MPTSGRADRQRVSCSPTRRLPPRRSYERAPRRRRHRPLALLPAAQPRRGPLGALPGAATSIGRRDACRDSSRAVSAAVRTWHDSRLARVRRCSHRLDPAVAAAFRGGARRQCAAGPAPRQRRHDLRTDRDRERRRLRRRRRFPVSRSRSPTTARSRSAGRCCCVPTATGGIRRTSGGFLRPGDLGAIDEDGRLVVFGRREDVIVSGGRRSGRSRRGGPRPPSRRSPKSALVGVPDPEWQPARSPVSSPGLGARHPELPRPRPRRARLAFAPRELVLLDRSPGPRSARSAVGARLIALQRSASR